jgi:hypothetical protein
MPEIMGLPPAVFSQRIPYHISLSAFLASSFIFVGGNGTVLQVYLTGMRQVRGSFRRFAAAVFCQPEGRTYLL